MSAKDPDDPKGLIRESFRIDGITDAECRSILIDWALSLPAGTDVAAAASRLVAQERPADHPMTRLLTDAGALSETTGRRRGGRGARLGYGVERH